MKEFDEFIARQAGRYKSVCSSQNKYFGEFRSRRMTRSWIFSTLESIRKIQVDFVRDDQMAQVKYKKKFSKDTYFTSGRDIIMERLVKYVSLLENDLQSLETGATGGFHFYQEPLILGESGFLETAKDDDTEYENDEEVEKADENLFEVTMSGKNVNFSEDEPELPKSGEFRISENAGVLERKFLGKANTLIRFGNMLMMEISTGLETVSMENGADFCNSIMDELAEHYKRMEKVYLDIIEMAYEAGDVPEEIENHDVLQEDFLQPWKKAKNEAIVKINAVKRNKHENQRNGNHQNQEYSQIKLPEIKVEKFKGELDKYLAFKNSIVNLIDMYPNISEDNKLKILLQHLTEKPINSVKSARTYSRAWELLDASFGRKRNIGRVYLDKLFNQDSILDKNDGESLKAFEFTMEESIEGLRAIKCPPDEIILWCIMPKLPLALQDRFNELHSGKDFHSLSDLSEFLKDHIIVLDSREKRGDHTGVKKGYQNNLKKFGQNNVNKNEWQKGIEGTKTNCMFCNDGSHCSLENCQVFKGKTVDERFKFVKNNFCCFRCLSVHKVKECKSESNCSICNKNHNTLLHFQSKKTQNNGNNNTQNALLVKMPEDGTDQKGSSLTLSELDKEAEVLSAVLDSKHVLLASADVYARAKDESTLGLRAILDMGSQTNFITEEAAQSLRLPIKNIESQAINGILCSKSNIKRSVSLKFSSIHNQDFSIEIEALVVKRITGKLPNKEFSVDHIECAKNILLADKNFNIPSNVDVLLSAEILAQIVRNQIFKDPSGNLLFQSTELGYIVYGALPINSNGSRDKLVHLVASEELSCSDMIKKVLDAQQEDDCLDENEKVEKDFVKTVHRLPSGSVQVSMPLVQDKSILGDSRRKALACFLRLESRLKIDSRLYAEYKLFMKGYLDMGHMEPVNLNDKKLNFLTHHAVIRSDAVTTKLRVVFNASSKTMSGYSLNDLQPAGPKLQADIWEILLNWRFYSHVFTADIKNMFRTIFLSEKDRDVQSIIWRDSSEEPLKVYRLTTVTYGTKVAPFLAKRTLLYIAMQEKERIEKQQGLSLAHKNLRHKAINILINLVYTDDIYGGGYSSSHLKKIKNIIFKILSEANMELHKFSSNCLDVLSDLDVSKLYNGKLNFDDSYIKTLGVLFCPKNYSFRFEVKDKTLAVNNITKKQMLSSLSKIFDPLGFLAPVNLKLKMLWQDAVSTGINWDENVSTAHLEQYNKIVSEMHLLESIRISRWLNYKPGDKVEIHGFCDASKRAYGAVIYIKIFNGQSVSVSFLRAKTHLFKIDGRPDTKQNTMTNPRKELCAALLLAEILDATLSAFKKIDLSVSDVFAYSDNQVVLYWIHNEHVSYPVFIQNRVKKIRKLQDFWCYVNTKDNPADMASRGIMPSKIINNDLWWSPLILKGEVKPERFIPSEELPLEESVTVALTHLNVSNNENLTEKFIEKFSNYKRLIRKTIFIQKFILYACNKSFSTTIDSNDYENAELALIRFDQKKCFFNEYNALTCEENISSKSRIKNLCPFIDQDQVLRVNGRLGNAHLPKEEAQPLILCHSGHLACKIMESAHYECLHGAKSLTVAVSRNKYWILKGSSVARRIIKRCAKCIRFGAKTVTQQMGELPGARVLEARPFSKTGLDYAGPFTIKSMVARGKRLHKAYACIFVCMVTKAVHIELVGDLTAEKFLMAYERFTARRGNCSELYSDNGSNFVMGKKLLDKDCRLAILEGSEFLQNYLIDKTTKWRNIPPLSPHHGGLWEAGVKSMKYHLIRVLGDSVLTFEELNTYLIRIEACLNSRPLTAMSNDPESFLLTPGHFLIGDAILAPPQPKVRETISTKGGKLVRRKIQEAWTAWRQDVLKSMMPRRKWTEKSENVEAGDVVILKNEDTPPTVWPLGRVQRVHPGKDGKVRVVTIRTANKKEFTRPVTKLVPLVKSSNSNDNETDEKKKKSKAKNRKRKVGRNSGFNMVSILSVLMVLCFGFALGKPYTITKFNIGEKVYFDHKASVRFSKGEINIFTFTQLSAYYDAAQYVHEIFDEIKDSCENFTNDYADSSCNNIILEFSRKLESFEAYELLIRDHHVNKRAVPLLLGAFGIGFGAGTLVGAFLHSSNIELDEKISLLTKNQEKIIALYKNNTSIVENSLRLINYNEINIKNDIKYMERNIQNVVDIVNREEYYIKFIKQCIHFMVNFDLIKSKQKIIIELLHTKKHKMEPTVLSYEDFRKEIGKIQIAKDISLAINLKDLYMNANVMARVTKNNIMFWIKVPLVSKEEFEIYEIFPIPFQVKEKYYKIDIEYKYIITNSNKTDYILKNSLKNCNEINELLVCDENHLSKRSVCEIDLMRSKLSNECRITECNAVLNEFINIRPNVWIVYAPTTTKMHFDCTSSIHDIILDPQVSTLEVHADCTISNEDWTLFSYKVINSTMSNCFIPRFNSTKWTDSLSSINISLTESKPLEEILTLADELRQAQEVTFDKIVTHPYAQMSLWICFLIVIILIIFGWLYHKHVHQARISEKSVNILQVLKHIDQNQL